MGKLRDLATGHQWEKIPNDVRIVMLGKDARIQALKARIAKADKLADILQSAIIEHDTADYPPDAENPWTMQEWFSDEDRAALAAYREGSDT